MFDYIIVGAGSAGCVLAARLTENPRARVLLLEAGGVDSRREVAMPAAFHKLFKTECDWAFETEPQARLAGRRLFWPRGKMLGGSSSMNAMIYIRGHAGDYDHWAALGNPGWSWSGVAPLFKRMEDNARGASEHHGAGGPMRVEDPQAPNPLSRAFVEACTESGIARNPDFNGSQQDGAGIYQVTQRGGRRESAATAYLRPALRRKNLGVRTGAHVTRVIFEGQQAIGVEYLHDGEIRVASCTREVILCGGAVHSPQLLLASGVGPAAALESRGVEVVADVPGVGGNLQDHLAVPVAFECVRPITLDNAENLWNALRYALTRSGPLRSNLAEAGAFLRTHSDAPAPDIQLHFVPAFWMNHALDRPQGSGFTIGVTQLRPGARGAITLRAANPLEPPAIDPQYLSAPEDLRVLIAGIRMARRIASAHALDGSRGAERYPGLHAETDDALAAYIARAAQTLYHPAGTCRMGPLAETEVADSSAAGGTRRIPADPLAVVDSELRVRGVTGLRVADASIMPTLIGGNTNAPTMMIAERAASLLS